MKTQFMTIKEEKELKQKTFKENAKLWFEQKKYLSQSFANGIKKVRKVAGAVMVAALVLQVGMGVFGTNATTTQSGTPNLIGSLAVANVTTGGSYKEDFVDAKVDDVVKFEMIYHNYRPPSSGIVAHNVNVKIALPTGQSTNLVATGTAKGSDTNTLTDTAAVHTQVPANLEYVAGSAKWKHNVGTNEAPNWVTQNISDSIVSTGYNVGNVLPCENFQGSITILARLKASSLKVEKKVTFPGQSWTKEITAKPGDEVAYMISFTNMGNTRLTNMIVGDRLPNYMTYVSGSTNVVNSTNPSGINVSDGITTGGIRVGDYDPGANGFVRFKAKITTEIPAGCHSLKNIGSAKADQTLEVWDSAYVKVCRELPPPPCTPHFVLSKSAYNETQKVNATSTFAHAGDVIKYTLNTKNDGACCGEYEMKDDISGILKYADLTDNGGGTLTDSTINYGNTTIQPGQTVTKTFTVKVKSFAQWQEGCQEGLQMVNVYGNQVVVKLGCYEINQSKSAYNDTQKVDATSKKAEPGDSITYTLTTSNTGNDKVTGYVISDDISDILKDADITSNGGGTLTSGMITWPAEDINAGSSIKKMFTVKVKDSLAKSCGNFEMVNVYGNTVKITIEVPCKPLPVPTVLGEQISKLAAAGGNGLLMALSMLIMFASSVYLYIREKLLLKQAMRSI